MCNNTYTFILKNAKNKNKNCSRGGEEKQVSKLIIWHSLLLQHVKHTSVLESY